MERGWPMIRVVTILVIAGMLLTGCQTIQEHLPKRKTAEPVELEPLDTAGEPAPTLPEPGLQLNTEQRFADVPLPVDVKPDEARTFVYESTSLQVGRMVYLSKASTTELAQFYIREAPSADWLLENVVEADGAELVFTKPGKRLTVTIRKLSAGRGRLLTLTLIPEEKPGSGL